MRIPRRYADQPALTALRLRQWMPWLTPADWDAAGVATRQAWLDAVVVFETERARRDEALAQMIAREVAKVAAAMFGGKK